jgi:hypothetical protein
MSETATPIEQTRDRFLLWPLLATIGWPLALMIVSIVPVIGYLLFVSPWRPYGFGHHR